MKERRVYYPTSKKPRGPNLDLDKFYLDQRTIINRSSVIDLKKLREKHKIELEKLSNLIRDGQISDGLRRFLKGKRKMITNLLSDSKKRIKLYNSALNNRVSTDLAKRFIKNAADQMEPFEFQHILGISLSQKEREDNILVGLIKPN